MEIMEKLEEKLGIKNGGITEDLRFSLDATRCIGACGLAPAMTVNGKVYPAMTKEKAAEIIKAIKEEEANA